MTKAVGIICAFRVMGSGPFFTHNPPDLAAPNLGIEALPDIDFNIRAGNTLVGYANLDEIKKSMEGDWVSLQSLATIEENAEIADRAFQKFHEMQTEHGMEAKDFSDAKLELRKRLKALEEELNHYLAQEYGIDPAKRTQYEKWLTSHKPFHWFIEFYGIMQSGGFDVIIGNPPYVETKNVSDYKVRGYVTESCGDLYAYTLERALTLICLNGRLGFIVPLSCFSVEGFLILQEEFLANTSPLFISNWSGDAHPAKLFEGVDKRLEIVVARKYREPSVVFTSKYLKWYASERPHLFNLSPTYHLMTPPEKSRVYKSSLPKINSDYEWSILKKLRSCKRTVGMLSRISGRHKIYYTRKVSFFLQFLNFVPEVRDNRGRQREPSELKVLCFEEEQSRNLCLASLSTSLFYWYNIINSDCRNLNKREIVSFPIPPLDDEKTQKQINDILGKLMRSYRDNSSLRTVRYADQGNVTVQYFNFRPSKPIIDEIDCVLAKHYGFTNEELDFIINYDIKYRMGQNAEKDDGD